MSAVGRCTAPARAARPTDRTAIACEQCLTEEGGTSHGSRHQRPHGDHLRGVQGARPGLRLCPRARGRLARHLGARRRGAGGDGGGASRRDRRQGHHRAGRCDDRGRPRRAAGRLPGPGHPHHQCRRAAAGRVFPVRAGRLAPGDRGQHADAHRADPRGAPADDGAALWPGAEHHQLFREDAHWAPGTVQRRAGRADRRARLAGAARRGEQRHHQPPPARALRHGSRARQLGGRGPGRRRRCGGAGAPRGGQYPGRAARHASRSGPTPRSWSRRGPGRAAC